MGSEIPNTSPADPIEPKSTAPPLLSVRDLTVTFEGRGRPPHPAVRGISFDVYPGETVGLVGESGSGKSVTALSILGLLPPAGCSRQGRIDFLGNDLTQLAERELRAVRGNQIAMVFQEPMTSLNPVFTCGEQVAEVFRLHRHASRKLAEQQAKEMFERVQLADPSRIVRSYPHQLSGGMRQRVMIAMALACSPRLLIADEPTTALDVTIQSQILALLRQLQQEEGLAILLITHDLGVVGEMCSRFEVMQGGHIVESGTPRGVFRKPQHPYTRALLAALPGTRGVRLKASPGLQSGEVESPEPVLRVTDLQTHLVDRRDFWGRTRSLVRAVDGVSFSIGKGETLGIVGESGSGKTTLARSILRLVEPTSGKVTFRGEPFEDLRGAALRGARRRLQIIFQDPFASLNPRMQVWQALAEVLTVHHVVPPSAVADQVDELLRRVGLDPRSKQHYPHEFSGGERQRIVIARALAVRPEMLICDEPVSSLDVSIQAQILDLLGHLQADLGLSYLFISHDIRVIRQVSDRIAVMRDGRFVEIGPVEQVLDHPRHEYTRTLLAACPEDPRVAS